MAEIHFQEIDESLLKALGEAQEKRDERAVIDLLSVPSELFCDALEIILGLSASVSDGASVAFAYLDKVLYARVFDGERYLFPLPFMLTEDASSVEACINIASYATREMLPLIITDVPREELEFVCSVFPHVDAFAYEDDDDCFFVKINNECDMLDFVPSVELDGIVLDEILESDKEKYAELCRDRELNKYWGYDADVDNPSADADFYLKVVRREFADGVALTLAIRESGEFVGEATVYGFDFMGRASIAVRVLRGCHSRGIGSKATKALIKLAEQIGVSELTAEILNENENSIKMTSRFMKLQKRTESKTFFTLSL